MLSPVQLPRVRSSTGARPRVLLADNHPKVLKIATRLLSSDFDVVGTAEDGRQALALSSQLDPDVVVLDVGMPKLDGFQTLQELRRIGSRAKVVMLTMHETEEYVTAAIDAGAQGYVVKVDMYSDLISAIDHVFADRIFVPSLPPAASAGCDHAVLFHANDDHFLDEASRLAADRLETGDLVVIVGTAEMRGGIAQRLENSGPILGSIMAQKRYIEFDAAESLSKFIREGRPDAGCVADIVADLDRKRVVACGPESRLTLIGELAAILCRQGQFQAAVEVEQTWSRLTRDLPFFTVCCYSAECFQDSKSVEMFPMVCAEHRAVSHAFTE